MGMAWAMRSSGTRSRANRDPDPTRAGDGTKERFTRFIARIDDQDAERLRTATIEAEGGLLGYESVVRWDRSGIDAMVQ